MAPGEGEKVLGAVKIRLRLIRNHPLREEERETASLGCHTTNRPFVSALVPLNPVCARRHEADVSFGDLRSD